MPDITVRHPDGSTATHSLAPDEELLVGRTDAAPGRIQLDSPNVSRDHARIWSDAEGALQVEDLGSSNGTLVNGRRAPQGQPVTLAEGDTITIDKFSLSIGEPAEESQGSPEEAPDDDKTPPPSRRPSSPPPSARQQPKSPPSPDVVLARLVLISPTDDASAGTEIPISHVPASVGRGDDCAITLNHSSVSSSHARFEAENGQWQIVDLKSTNGVRVNEEPIPAGDPCAIKDGDMLCIGLIVAQFFLGDAAAAAEARAGESSSLPAKLPANLKLIIFAAAIALFLFLQLIWYTIHRRAESAYRSRKWKETQRQVDRLPVVYLLWSSAQQLRDYATTDIEKSVVVGKIRGFPPLLRAEDVDALATLLNDIPPDSALYADAKKIVSERMEAYVAKAVASVDGDLKPGEDDPAYGKLFARIGEQDLRLDNLKETLRLVGVRTNVSADRIKQFEADAERLHSKWKLGQQLSEAASLCAKPTPDDLDGLRSSLQAANERVKQMAALKADAAALGYEATYNGTMERLRARQRGLDRSRSGYERATQLLRDALKPDLAPGRRFDRLDEADELLDEVSVPTLQDRVKRDSGACRKALTAFQQAGISYQDNEFAKMRRELDVGVDTNDQTLHDALAGQKWASLRVCSAAESWEDECDRFREVPSLASDLLDGLKRKSDQLLQHEQKAHLVPSLATKRAAGLALVAYFAGDLETAAEQARAAGPKAAESLKALVDPHTQAQKQVSPVKAELTKLRGRIDDSSVPDFGAAAQKLSELASKRDECRTKEKQFAALADPRFRSRPGPFSTKLSKDCAALDAARNEVYEVLTSRAEKKVLSLRESILRDDATVTSPTASRRSEWLECVVLCHKAAKLRDASALGPLLERIVGVLIPARTDRMDAEARGFWLSILRQISKFPELPDRLQFYLRSKLDDLQAG